MFIYIHQMEWRGKTLFTAFIHNYRRRFKGRVRVAPDCQMVEMTAEEIGQLLGGN